MIVNLLSAKSGKFRNPIKRIVVFLANEPEMSCPIYAKRLTSVGTTSNLGLMKLTNRLWPNLNLGNGHEIEAMITIKRCADAPP